MSTKPVKKAALLTFKALYNRPRPVQDRDIRIQSDQIQSDFWLNFGPEQEPGLKRLTMFVEHVIYQKKRLLHPLDLNILINGI